MRALVLLVLMALLAGCSDSGDDGGSGTTPAAPPSDTGTIAGVVVDERIQALPEVEVRLTPGTRVASTDLFGRFDFLDVEPGSYELRAELDGVFATEQVTVEAGERERPRIILNPPRPRIPVHETLAWDGYKELHMGPVDNETASVKQQFGLSECACGFRFAIDQDLVALVIEAVWEDSIDPGQAGPSQYDWTLTTPSGWRASGSGASPLLARVTEADFGGSDGVFRFAEQGVLDVTLEPGDGWIAAQQEYQLFITTWMVEGPPEGWSWISGDA